MATLTEPDRSDVWGESMRDGSLGTVAISKIDLRAAVNAVDEWIEASQAGFNAAIPQPARASLSAKQKSAILMAVVSKRFRVS